HNGPVAAGPSLLRRTIEEAGLAAPLHLAKFAPAEAQAAALADDIAYMSHDLDDGLRAGLLRLEDLRQVPLAGPFMNEVPGTADRQRVTYEVNRRLITAMIEDAVAESRTRLAALARPSLTEVREAKANVIALSAARRAEVEGLREYLMTHLYRHPQITAVMAAAERIVADLFHRYQHEPGEMPQSWRAAGEGEGRRGRRAAVAPFVARRSGGLALTQA